MNKALVSVIIPTFSRPTNLTRAIDSVLAQTYRPIEIIVVDDNGLGSIYQQETESILRNYIEDNKITYIKHDINKNGSAARNTGFRLSKGAYVNFLDDDDTFSADKLEQQVLSLESNSIFSACFCDTIEFFEGKEYHIINDISKTEFIMEDMLMDRIFFNTSAVLFRRTVIEDLNGFDETFFRHQDYELYMRFFRKYKIIKSEKGLVYKYATPNVVTRSPGRSLQYMEYFLESFKEDIAKYPQHKKIYQKQYENLAKMLFRNGCFKDGWYCVLTACKNGIPSINTVLRYVYWTIHNKLNNR